MTNRNSKSLFFPDLNRKKVEVNFDGGEITSDAGALLLRQVDEKLKLTETIAGKISDWRDPSKTHHSILDMLRQRVYGFCLGYEDLNDFHTLRKDTAFKTAVGVEHDLASQASLSRFENQIDRQTLFQINASFADVFINSQKVTPQSLILDFDPSDTRTHGDQIGSRYHGYYGHTCFLPLYVYCGDQLLVCLNREGNADGPRYAGAILKLLVQRLRREWPKVEIIFRADSAFARPHLLNWCDKNNVSYVIAMPKNPRLAKLALPNNKKAAKRYCKTSFPSESYDSFYYQADSWAVKRRVVVKSVYHDDGCSTRFILTNMNYHPELLYKEIYCGRGDMENSIKFHQQQLFSDRVSCHEFDANSFRMLLSSIAYILLDHLRRVGLKNTPLEKAEPNTIRLKLLKIGAVIIKNTRRIRFYLADTFPFQDLFIKTNLIFQPG